jgi:putative DNA primase/helicase
MIDFIDDFVGLGYLDGTEGEDYLRSRGITIRPKKGVRFSNLEYESESEKQMSAIVSVMTNDRMKISFIHKTFLKDGKKAEGINAKKIYTAEGLAKQHCNECGLSSSESIAVRLFDCKPTLGIAEGLETALSATQIYNVPTWMVGNATHLKNFVAPNSVRHLIIYADNDKTGTGLAAAFYCGNRNILNKNSVKKVTIKCPKDVGDFNDMLKTQSDVMDWVLEAK